jgi:hypothetical protein
MPEESAKEIKNGMPHDYNQMRCDKGIMNRNVRTSDTVQLIASIVCDVML